MKHIANSKLGPLGANASPCWAFLGFQSRLEMEACAIPGMLLILQLEKQQPGPFQIRLRTPALARAESQMALSPK